jgi:hypothetical protein
MDDKTPAEPESEVEDNRPSIARLFETVGIVKGAAALSIRFGESLHLNNVRIVDIAAAADPLEVVLVVRELGLDARHVIRWSTVSSIVFER